MKQQWRSIKCYDVCLEENSYSRKFYCALAITELVAIMRKGELTEESCKIHVYILSSLKVTFFTASKATRFQYHISPCRINSPFPKNRNYDVEHENSFA